MVLVAGSIATPDRRRPPGGAAPLLLLGQLVFASVPFTFLAGLLREPRRARRRRRRAARAARRGAWHGRPARPAGRGARRPLAGGPLLGRRRLGPARRPARRAAGRRRSPARLDGGRARGPARRRDRPRAQPARRARGRCNTVAAAAGLAMRAAGALEPAALRRSRARIVEAGLAERRRLERNLHDGAQQRLVALSPHAADRPEQDRHVAREGDRDGRRRAGGAPARARGAARARPRHPPGRALRPRPAGRRRGARRALPAAGPASSRSRASGCPSRSRRPPTS